MIQALHCHSCGSFWEQSSYQPLKCLMCRSDIIEIVSNYGNPQAAYPRAVSHTSTTTSSAPSNAQNVPLNNQVHLQPLPAQNVPLNNQVRLQPAVSAQNIQSAASTNAPPVNSEPSNSFDPYRTVQLNIAQRIASIRATGGGVLLLNGPLTRNDDRVARPQRSSANSGTTAAAPVENNQANNNNRVNNPPRARSRSPINRPSADEPTENKVCSRSMTAQEMNKIQRIYRKDLTVDETECGICYEGYKDRRIIRRLKCSHTYHQLCIFAWLKKDSTCPFCRCNLVDATEGDDSNNNNNDQPGLASRN